MLLEVTCPHCQAPATQMPILSEISTHDFFLCSKCGKVSEREKASKVLTFGPNDRRDATKPIRL